MAMFGTANPALGDSAMDRIRAQANTALAGGGRTTARMPGEAAEQRTDVMTVSGTSLKCLMLLGLVLVTAAIAWGLAIDPTSGQRSPWLLPLVIGGAIGGLIVALITIFKPRTSPVTAPIYAALEGLVLGAISALFHEMYDVEGTGLQNSIVFQAVLLTLSIAASMFALYALRIIKVTAKLRAGIMIATMGVFLTYAVSFVLGFFGMSVPFLHSSGPMGIGISVLIVGIAAFNLLLDFDFIERGSQEGMPKWAEWYGAFGLMVTLVWLYLEVLRLLAKLRSR